MIRNSSPTQKTVVGVALLAVAGVAIGLSVGTNSQTHSGAATSAQAASCAAPSYDGSNFAIQCTVPQATVTVTAAPSTTAAPSSTPATTPPVTSASPTPSPSTTAPSTGFPGASNTGVPAGTVLTPYTGPTTLSSGTIDSKTINGTIMANGPVTIKNSRVTNARLQTNGSGSLTLTDDEIIGSNTDEQFSVIFGPNITATRINVHGGKANLQCEDHGCVLKDSWLHDPWLMAAYHYDVVGSNAVNGMTLDHNTLQCKFAGGSGTGGCSADLGFFGDFGPITNVTINNNLFMASSDPGYCVITNASKPGKAYPTGSNLHWTNNTFQKGSNGKCGQYGPVDEWQSGNGNVWSGNKWDDGTALVR